MALPSNDKIIGDLGHTADHNAIVDEIIYVKQNYYSASSTGVNFPEYLRRDSASAIYATKSSPALTGTPTAPTAASATNNTQIATTAFVRTAVSNLVSSAPETLDTLNELAAALGNDANFATSTASAIGQRLLASTASTLYLGINNTANHAATASSINWSLITNRPSASPSLNPQIGVNLTGDITGAASATLTSLSNGQISISTTIAANSVILGTDTTGNYVSGVTGGTGITITGTAGEGWSPTINIDATASVSWNNVSSKPSPIIGINLIGSITGAASATLTDLNNTQITINTVGGTGGGGSASSVDWSNVTNKPDPIVGVSLLGNTTGAASVTLTDLTNSQLSITTRTTFATSASSINWAGVTARPTTLSGYGIVDALSLASASATYINKDDIIDCGGP